MKLIHFFTFSFLFIYQFSFSQDVDSFPFKKSSLLWKIEGNGAKTSYLFGTMHLIEKEFFIFPTSLQKKISNSEQVILELGSLPKNEEALKWVTLSNGTLFDYFNPEQTDSLLKWAEKNLFMKPEVFKTSMEKMKPFVLLQLATQMQFMGKTESYEISIFSITDKNKIPTIGLETIAQQMGYFDSLTPQQQTEMVMEGIRNKDESFQKIKEMQLVYQKQEIDLLYQLIQNEGGVISEAQSTFLDDRNKAWIPKITQFITDKKSFIAVGAGHLGGPNGIIRLLQTQGYQVTPIKL